MNTVKFITINTKGHCFFCLREYNSEEERLKSLKILARYLNIEVGKLFKSWNQLVSADKLDVSVSLCEKCDQAYSKLSTIFQLLEFLQMEMDYSVKELQKTIKLANLDHSLKEKYHKTDGELGSLLQLEISDRLRDIIQNKYTTIATLGKMFVKIKPVKSEAEIKPAAVPIIQKFSETTHDDLIMNQNVPKVSEKPRKIPRQTRRSRKSFKQWKRVQCKICKKRFTSPSNLKHHYSVVHLGVKYFCTVFGCGKATQGYSRRDKVWKHMKTAHVNLFPSCKNSFKEMVDPNFISGMSKTQQDSDMNSSAPIIMGVWSEQPTKLDIEYDYKIESVCKTEPV